ncbi:glucose-1-phosphate adenylyltransferase [Desulfogranum marinum]|uniref:glucose-1-phosphate adenylyltransferase n=1 Tax=Desulfogranum marinum TaxID=453220 RepID=UPI00196333A3|nr:glucose-1-phosphate adenylyltransferase [Desulfogranum marinum]MBM9514661.1 glucose-1-phosphate adenylyltransferase [Desulfogranum marinum]
MMNDVLGLIMGGGRGTRLYPLTKKRSKPAVPVAGKYRLIDIPVSNCLHSGIDKIAILTQFNSVSLHRHIFRTYRRDMFTDGWVQILAAEQTPGSTGWYQGTADAVRQQLVEIKNSDTKYVIILAGDHLYRMNYKKFVEYHVESKADITLAVQPVSAQEAPALGILKRNSDGEITRFSEKPGPELLDDLISTPDSDKPFMASMGIYVFSTEVLSKLLSASGDDFGSDIIPKALSGHKVMGHVFDGYWADIGTIRRFYEVNLELAGGQSFDLNAVNQPVYTNARFLPPTELQGAKLSKVLLAKGCRIGGADISNSVVGLRSVIGSKVVMRDTIMMGSDFHETDEQRAENICLSRPDIGIGDGSVIESAILDKKARIGRNVHIRSLPDRPDSENDNWVVRDGLVVVPKSGVIPDNTVI